MHHNPLDDTKPAIDTMAPPASDDALASRVVAFWTRDYLAHSRVVVILAALFVAYLTCLFLLGPVPSTVYGNDVFLLLDGGWRILNGSVPNHDFYLSLGPVTYMWVAAGLWLAHNSAYGLSIGFLLFAALITVFAFLISRNRMTSAGSILFSIFILLLCTGPMPLGHNSSTDLSCAMIYNRFGYGLLSIIFIIQLLPPDTSHGDTEDWFPGIVAGASLVILFFLKVSYFGVGAGLVLLSTLADFRNIRRLLALACGFALTTLAMLAFLRFDVAAVVHDLLDTIHARSGAISHFGIADVFEMSTIVFIAVALAVCFLGVSSGRNRIWLFAAALYTVAAEALFVRTNAFQGTTYPLYIVFTFILLANLGKNLRARQYSSASFTASLVVIGLSLMVPNFYTHLRSLALLMRYKTNAELRAGAYRVEGDHMRDLAFYNHQENEPMRQENGQFYTGSLNDGIDLLKKYSTSSDMVTTIGFHNPFSYALLRKPPRAGSTWLLMDNNVSAGHMLSNERMFGDATLVMVPKYVANTHFQNDQILFREYAPYLLSHFTFVAESDRWRLYRRLPGR